MSHPVSEAVKAARLCWMRAPEGKKPAALYLARKYGVNESTIHRARARWIAEKEPK